MKTCDIVLITTIIITWAASLVFSVVVKIYEIYEMYECRNCQYKNNCIGYMNPVSEYCEKEYHLTPEEKAMLREKIKELD